MVSLAWFAHTWKLAERVKVAMSVRRNFSRGTTSTFCLLFSGCWRCNADGRLQNAVLFLHHKENSPWKHALHSHLFEIFFKWSCRLYEFATIGVLSIICYNFCWIGAWMSLSSWTPHKWVWNWTVARKSSIGGFTFVRGGFTFVQGGLDIQIWQKFL